METEINQEAEETATSKKAPAKKFRISANWIAILAFLGIFGIFVGVTLAFRSSSDSSGFGYSATSGLSKEEMTILVKSLNPMQQKALSENPQQKEVLIKQLTQLLAIAKQAGREGVTAKPLVRGELKFLESAVVANSYDEKTSKVDAPQGAPFAGVSEDRVKKFWAASDVEPGIFDSLGFKSVTPETRTQDFQGFIDGKIAIAKESGQIAEDMKPSEEELKMAKDVFAKTMIVYGDALKKFGEIIKLPEAEKKDWTEFEKSVRLQVKLQQAQFLAQYYNQSVLTKKLEVTDAEIAQYMKEHPELGDKKKKKADADAAIKKLDAGADFAELAKEMSEDPGSKENGGLYEKAKSGQMDPAFEKAALALEPGSYTKEPVETKFGYHIIKLESKNETKGEDGKPSVEYSVRHILISTQIKDPKNPIAPQQSAEDFVKSTLQAEREKKIMDEILAKNPINIPTDFEIPKPSEAEIQKLMEQQRPPGAPVGPGGPPQGPQSPPPPPGPEEGADKGGAKK